MNLAAVPDDSSTHFNNSLTTVNRRRSLFPCEDTDSESDSDLGHISPLNFDSSFDKGNFNILTKQSQNVSKMVGEYDIIGVVENQNQLEYTPQGKNSHLEVMSPLYLSPHYNKMETTFAETPSKTSPFFKLKTPHDAPNTSSKLPKLSRKSLLDSEVSSNTSKRKLSPDKSPNQNKQIKLDSKFSRVRTTLFPEVDFALSTKSFYPKSEDILAKIMNKTDTSSKSAVLLNGIRKSKTRRKMGQINAGVGHKIRKPKHKKFTKMSLVKTSLNSTGNSAITEYIMDLKELKSGNNPPMIENKENAQPPQKFITPAIIAPQKTLESKKRPLSPTFEPDLNKKFFKFSRAKGVIKMSKSIQLEVDNGKLSILETNRNKSKNNFDMSDLTVDDSEIIKTDIDSILSLLEDDKEAIPQENIIVLQATNSVVSSDNSILLHQPTCTADLILSPISHMCDVTSGLALNTPKKVKNLTPILEELEQTESTSDDQKLNKLFPVFYTGHTGATDKKEKVLLNAEKKFNKLSDNQMLIDAGQKKFGIIQCTECNFVYHQGDPNDEIMHFDFHSATHIMKFPGWKNEKVVANFQGNGRIIQILPGDSKMWWKKIKELMDTINVEIGCYDMEFSLENCEAFLYIKKKIIVGCLIATPKTEGYQMLTSMDDGIDLCSECVHPIKCGIPRIWVSPKARKLGIATQMMNVLKKNFIKGSLLYDTDIAFSSPTDQGKAFAQRYFKTKNFYIYF